MLALSAIMILINVVLPTLMAPTTKPDVFDASDMVNALKKFQSQLNPLNEQFQKIVEAFEKDRQEKSEHHEEHEENAEEQNQDGDKENDDFILRVAQKITSKVSIDDPPEKIDSLVNSTSYHLVSKMNATRDHLYEFTSKLKGAVLKILNERSEKYEPPVNKSLPAGPSGVDQSKVVQALEELLEGSLISGFVSQEQERQMIRSAITALSKDFGISDLTTEDIIQAMITHVQQDVKSFSTKSDRQNNTARPMTDEEKILGMEKMVEDKVTENNLNLDEMKYLVKGLAAAVGARNELSEEKTKSLEAQINKGVHDFFANNKIPDNKQSEISQSVTNENVPEEKYINETKRSFEIEHEEEDKKDDNLSELLEDLEKKWNEEKKSSVEAQKQKQYLKEILSNSLALMESLDTEKKQHHTESKSPSQTEKKEHSTPKMSKHIEPTKQATHKPTNKGSKHVTHTTTKEQSVKSIAVSTKTVKYTTSDKNERRKKTTVSSHNEPVEKKGGLSDDMEKEIEEAEAEIQQELEIEQREDEKKMKKHEKTQNEKENSKKETKQKSKISKEEIDATEKEIEKELEEQAKALESKVTTAKPAATKKDNVDNELIKQLDDLFQDS